MNKSIVVIGALAILGVGAYFYFKPESTNDKGADKKSKGNKSVGNLTAGTTSDGSTSGSSTSDSSTSVPPTGTILTTPEQVAELARKIAVARDLATKLNDLRIERNELYSTPAKKLAVGIQAYANYSEQVLQQIKDSRIFDYDQKIKNLNEQIGQLGFMEVNGAITKIV